MSVIQNRLLHARYGEGHSMNLDDTNFVNGHDVQ
jgi:hypothetical protein